MNRFTWNLSEAARIPGCAPPEIVLYRRANICGVILFTVPIPSSAAAI
jgi:hypothetical protein